MDSLRVQRVFIHVERLLQRVDYQLAKIQDQWATCFLFIEQSRIGTLVEAGQRRFRWSRQYHGHYHDTASSDL